MAMVIRSFEKMSYALIMEADFPITHAGLRRVAVTAICFLVMTLN